MHTIEVADLTPNHLGTVIQMRDYTGPITEIRYKAFGGYYDDKPEPMKVRHVDVTLSVGDEDYNVTLGTILNVVAWSTAITDNDPYA